METRLPVKLFIDTSGTNDLWLFEDATKNIISSANHFKFFLGESISGSILGNSVELKSFSWVIFPLNNQ